MYGNHQSIFIPHKKLFFMQNLIVKLLLLQFGFKQQKYVQYFFFIISIHY